MAIKIKLQGFDELFKAIEEAQGSIDKAAESCIKQSAYTMQAELKNQMSISNVSARLINGMPAPLIEVTPTKVSAFVGYEKGVYDPKNISDGYKIVFLNYGTPHRSKHGKVVARGFIQKAKKTANKKIKKQQKETLEKILGRLKK